MAPWNAPWVERSSTSNGAVNGAWTALEWRPKRRCKQRSLWHLKRALNNASIGAWTTLPMVLQMTLVSRLNSSQYNYYCPNILFLIDPTKALIPICKIPYYIQWSYRIVCWIICRNYAIITIKMVPTWIHVWIWRRYRSSKVDGGHHLWLLSLRQWERERTVLVFQKMW